MQATQEQRPISSCTASASCSLPSNPAGQEKEQAIASHLARGRLPHPHGGLEARLAQLAPHKALGVVGRQRLLVARLHDGNLLPRLVGEEVGAAQALSGRLRLLWLGNRGRKQVSWYEGQEAGEDSDEGWAAVRPAAHYELQPWGATACRSRVPKQQQQADSQKLHAGM